MTDKSAPAAPRGKEPLPFTDAEVESSLPERFAKVAATWPSAVAIATGTERLTYAELNRRSDGLAAAIVRLASRSEAPVAVLLTDQISMIIGMLATWKAGKLCVPLDAALPQSRLEATLRDAEAGLVVTDGDGTAALSSLPGFSERQLRVDEVDLLEPVELPRVTVTAERTACLLYTSGSTGRPKGVVRSHRCVLHRARCSVTSLAIGPEDHVSGLHSPSFGAGLRDMLTALLSAAALLPFDPRRAGLRALATWIDREQISVLCAVVTTFRHLLAELAPHERFPSVRVVRLGSEPLFRQDVERFRDHFRPDCLLVAGYGASEASGIVEYRMRHDTPLPAGRVPAGYAHEGVEILVLDEDARPVRDGQAGEVAVRSRYLSDGYWRQPELTRTTFLIDPIDAAARIYRTGDVGRLRPDGCLELLGRRDHQVKVRGYRVHPGEIELALAEHPAVREAVIAASDETDGATRLVAYVVPGASLAVDAAALRRFLRTRLPAYMMPAAFITLEALPLTPNGKVDRAALPPPPRLAADRDRPVVPPRTPLEHQIAAIWEDLLGVRPIGMDDDFLDLGGDSLLAAALVVEIEEACGRVLPPSVLWEASTVAELAATLLRQEGTFDTPLTALNASGARLPLFFLHGDYQGGGYYCQMLAHHLHPDRPFYAIHPHGLDGRAVPATIEAMAADRLQSVRAVRSQGPYILGGYCRGGLVALEMARQLRAQGERVEVVVLVERRAPGRGLRAVHRASNLIGRVVGLPPDGRAELFSRLEQVLDAAGLWSRYYQGRLRMLAQSDSRARAEFLGRKLAWVAGGFARVLKTPLARRGRAVDHASTGHYERHPEYHRAIRRYMPSPYTGSVAVLRAEEVKGRRPDLGWSRLLPRLEIAAIPGDHATCITRHVAALAARLEEILQRNETRA